MSGWKIAYGTLNRMTWTHAQIDVETHARARHEDMLARKWERWQRWYAWYPVRHAMSGGKPGRPWTWTWIWLEECGWRETSVSWATYDDYECQYVPWHTAVRSILMGD